MKIWMKGGSMREAGFDEPAGKEAFRHTTAHILAQAKDCIQIRNVRLDQRLWTGFIMILILVSAFRKKILLRLKLR